MTIQYIVPGSKRKELAKCIGAWLGEPVEYLGAPTFAYQIDYFTLDKNGVLSFDDRADSEVIERLIEHIYDEGFEFVEPNTTDNATDTEKVDGICISVPLSSANVANLLNLIEAKESLIQKAIGTDRELGIEVKEDKIAFHWFDGETTPEELQAYERFICALCSLSKKQKRVNGSEKKADNEKYAFRCFLLRLGFIGDEYKPYRKILLRNLEGSSAFKGGKKNV